jgi:hypothetical protein
MVLWVKTQKEKVHFVVYLYRNFVADIFVYSCNGPPHAGCDVESSVWSTVK